MGIEEFNFYHSTLCSEPRTTSYIKKEADEEFAGEMEEQPEDLIEEEVWIPDIEFVEYDINTDFRFKYSSISDEELDNMIKKLEHKKIKSSYEKEQLRKLRARQRNRKLYGERTEAEKEAMRKQMRERQQARRDNETDEEKEARRKMQRERMKMARDNQTEEQKEARRKIQREKMKARRDKLSVEEKDVQRKIQREKMRAARHNQEEDQKEARRKVQRERMKLARDNETQEEKEARRKIQRERAKDARKMKKELKGEHQTYTFCDQCNYQTMHNGSLKRHIESVHDNVLYYCEQCGYESSHRWSLKTHIDNIHSSTTNPGKET